MIHAFIYDAIRTPFGRSGGALAGLRPDDLAAHVIQASLSRVPTFDPALIDEVILGNANGAGEENRNVARMATLLSGLPTSIPGTTVNRLCGSSLDAAIIAARQIGVGDADVVLVGGTESMSRAPWVLPKTSESKSAGDRQLASTALGWRLVNPKMPSEWTVSLGEATEQLREKYDISRERQDAFAARSHQLADSAWNNGFFDDLVTTVPGTELTRDESIRPGSTVERLATLGTVFRPVGPGPSAGTITAGNASPLTDGASAAFLGSEAASDMLGMSPLARIAGRGAAAIDPQLFGFAPVEAANRALSQAGVAWSQVGAVEINEAFAAQSLACIDAWDIDPMIVNQHGGALAIGHPLGASGTRLLGTLARSLQASGERWGVAAICIGVGQGLAVVLENVSARQTPAKRMSAC
ncbi:thiolase family protein [Cryobacterium tagatosivorans]|uniref:Probable acetyl-CoA acetyltransferase n=1 Tax=Cryobacterium tagatosivorans TaxID=1259199 RepID=A0A4R8UGP6_9MICO|nr:thiolase family protein [Cryobacterium tagatosivorans]TFB55165.1 thiolase family protein [Cryobacterium tagatosivorans]